MIPTQSQFQIIDVSKPMKPQIAIQIFRFAYPVLIKEKLFYLPRDTEFKNIDILPAILNGIPININDNDEEIIIE